MRAPHLYLITDRRVAAGRPLASVVEAALAGAWRVPPPPGGWHLAVQLRDKDLGGAALYALASDLRRVTAAAGAALFVNGRLDVALAVGADGVHLGAGALDAKTVRRLAPDLRVGMSTHAPNEVRAAAAAGADFVVFGPVFETPSKQGLLLPRGAEALTAAAAGGVPVLALGGLDVTNAGACLEAGAKGLAVIRAVLGAPDPAQATAALLALLWDSRRP